MRKGQEDEPLALFFLPDRLSDFLLGGEVVRFASRTLFLYDRIIILKGEESGEPRQSRKMQSTVAKIG